MQIAGGRWEVCLGDGSCVLSFLSLPLAFLISILWYRYTASVLASPRFLAGSWPGCPLLPPHSAETAPGLRHGIMYWCIFEFLKS